MPANGNSSGPRVSEPRASASGDNLSSPLPPPPLVTAIICTIRPEAVIERVLDCLRAQTHQPLQVLIVGHHDGPESEAAPGITFQTLSAPKGLAPARNVGLRAARGQVIIYFDDDVSFGETFIAEAVACLARPEHADVGGLTGYDELNYGGQLTDRWRWRERLGITPSLAPGDNNHLGRSVTFGFFQPFSGCRDVKWLPGFCQIFRRRATEGLRYDEEVVVEDRDFSMEVGRQWRLVIDGDLKIKHHLAPEARHDDAKQIWRAAFGLGRSFAKRRQGWRDWVAIVKVPAGELLIDLMVLARHPTKFNFRVMKRRLEGYVEGFRTYRGDKNSNIMMMTTTIV